MIAIAALIGYLLGSIPFGYLLTRLAGGGDIRAIGSGSTGATNVLRTGRRGLAAATVLLDAGKGALAVLLLAPLAPGAALAAGAAAVVGHCSSPWIGFRGGKGVATGFGVVLAWSWPIGLACGVLWLVAAIISRRSSLASLVAVTAAPVLTFAFADPYTAPLIVLISALIIFRHQANIRRLLAGTEPRIGAK